MVQVTLTPWKGNHQRFFPHTGQLGLTPVVVQGVLRTALEEDRRPLKASEVLVRLRCYEVDKQQTAQSASHASTSYSAGKNSRKTRVLYEISQSLWRKQDGDEFSPLGDFTAAFKLALPADCPAVSTVTFKNYRAWWQVEAVVLHKPSSIFGSRTLVAHPIPLTRHEPASNSPSPPIRWSSNTKGAFQPRGFKYDVHLPESDYAPSDDFIVDLVLTRDEPALELVKVQVSIDRTLDLSSGSPSTNKPLPPTAAAAGSDEDVPEPPAEDEPLLSPADAEDRWTGRPLSKGFSSVFRRGSSTPKPLPPQAAAATYPTPPSPPSTESGSYFNAKAAAANSVQIVSIETDDIQWGNKTRLRGQVPKPKSFFRYSIGETMRTQLATISFAVSVKITVKRANGGQEQVTLEPKTITFRSVRAANQNSTPDWSTQPAQPKNGSSESLSREPLRAMA